MVTINPITIDDMAKVLKLDKIVDTYCSCRHPVINSRGRCGNLGCGRIVKGRN